MVFPIRHNRNDAPLPQGSAERFAVIALIQAEPFRTAHPFPNPNTVHGFQEVDLVIAIGAAEREVERMTMRVNDHMPFDA
jgi:hypothetical protein